MIGIATNLIQIAHARASTLARSVAFVLVLPCAAQEVTVVTGAGFAPGPVAPGSIASAFGAGFADKTTVSDEKPPPTELGGVGLGVTDSAGAERAAPLFATSAGQVNFAVPEQSAVGPATATVRNNGAVVAVGSFEIASVAPGLFSGAQGIAAGSLVRIDNDGDQSTENLLTRDDDNQLVPRPINMGSQGERLVVVLFGTGMRNGEIKELRIGSVHLASNDVGSLFLGPAPGFFGLDQINSGILPRRLEDFGGGLRDIRVFAGPRAESPAQAAGSRRSNVVKIAFAPNPDAPTLVSFALGGGPAEEDTTEVEIRYGFADRDGDLGPLRLHLLLTAEAGFCLSRIEDGGNPGETQGERQFSLISNAGRLLGSIQRAELSVRDEAGHNSAFYSADTLSAQGPWTLPCALFIPRGFAPAAATVGSVVPAEVREAAQTWISEGYQ